MKKPRVQQRTERRISAALRLVLVAVLLVAQIALVLFLSDLLRQRINPPFNSSIGTNRPS